MAKPRLSLIALVAVAAAAGGYVYLSLSPRPVPAPAPSPVPCCASPAVNPTPPARGSGPSFDILRVDAAGNAVIAGKADPGATVTIRDGKNELGSAVADPSGAFVFVPSAPLAAGAHALTLSEIRNGKLLEGETSASVNVAANPDGQSLAVITGANGSRIVSGQGPLPGQLGIGAVDYDANGHAMFAGTAPKGDHVTLTLDGAPLGTAVTGADGRWTIATDVPKNSGTLRLGDDSYPGTPPLSAPFALETLKLALALGHIVIVPGQNLWIIARHIYGHGTLYTLIYNANSRAIRNPNLIFPGQTFALPRGH